MSTAAGAKCNIRRQKLRTRKHHVKFVRQTDTTKPNRTLFLNFLRGQPSHISLVIHTLEWLTFIIGTEAKLRTNRGRRHFSLLFIFLSSSLQYIMSVQRCRIGGAAAFMYCIKTPYHLRLKLVNIVANNNAYFLINGCENSSFHSVSYVIYQSEPEQAQALFVLLYRSLSQTFLFSLLLFGPLIYS